MTFEEFIESTQSLCWSEDERELVEMVWRVAQEAEREKLDDELTAAFMMGYQAAKNDYGRSKDDV
jgi:hypothetical protein